MRNILTVLMLFVLTLTTSSVFAEKFDESKRTERMGLSFYDGRPMYYLYLGRPDGSSISGVPYPAESLYLHAERLRTGDNIADLPKYRENDGYVVMYSSDHSDFIIYGYDKDGNLEFLSNTGLPDSSNWMQTALKAYGPAAIAQASTGDLGISIFDTVSERLKPWLLPALGVALALFGVRYCYRLLVRMVQGESGVGLGGGNKDVSASRDDYGTSSDYVRPSFEVRDNLEQVDVSNADEYATGAAFGREFTSKAVASNVDLQNEWSRLSASERAELLGDAFESDFGGSPFGERAYPRRNNDFYNLIDEENEE